MTQSDFDILIQMIKDAFPLAMNRRARGATCFIAHLWIGSRYIHLSWSPDEPAVLAFLFDRAKLEEPCSVEVEGLDQSGEILGRLRKFWA
jgi:hypothetical protein